MELSPREQRLIRTAPHSINFLRALGVFFFLVSMSLLWAVYIRPAETAGFIFPELDYLYRAYALKGQEVMMVMRNAATPTEWHLANSLQFCLDTLMRILLRGSFSMLRFLQFISLVLGLFLFATAAVTRQWYGIVKKLNKEN